MTGFASPIFHRINASMLSLFSFVLPFFCLAMGMLKQCQHQCRAAGRFATEYLVQLIRLVPIRLVSSTVCLAMGLLFFSAAGAMAWEPGPDNYIPVADAGPDRVVRPGAKVKLDGRNSITRRSGGLNYSWARTGGTPGASVALKRANRKRPKFVADRLVAGDDDVIHIFTLTVRDTSGTAATDTVTITVDAPEIRNFPPVANAGQDQRVASGVVVQLDGRNSSDNEGEIASWSWRRTGGTLGKSVLMTNANTARPRFIADILPAGADDVVHGFTLTVTDHDGAIDTDWVWVRVKAPEAPNLPPVANAGPDQVVVSGDTVTLNGSASSDRDGTITYSWKRVSWTSGSSVRLNNPNTAYPSFTAILPADLTTVTHVFKLTVTDDDGAVDQDRVTITVESPEPPNLPPIANAGPDQVVVPGDTVILNGSSSSDRDGTITYSWRQVQGPSGNWVRLNDPNTAYPSFTAILPADSTTATHVFILTVTDDDGVVDEDRVTITVEAPEAQNLPPVSNAGPDQVVVSGDTVTLNGSGSSDTDGTIASWSWRRTGGTPGRSVVMTDANTARPRFTTDILPADADDVIHGFTLTVTDNNGAIDTDWVWITVNAAEDPNLPPIANAGPNQRVVSGVFVQLDGRNSSDNDGEIASWFWQRTGGSPDRKPIYITNANTARPHFKIDTLRVGSKDILHGFTLTVTDNNGAVDTDTVWIIVRAPVPGPPPIVNAGPDQVVVSGDTVTLNGSVSSDRDGTIAYFWKRVAWISGSSALLNEPFTAYPSFTAILPADFTIIKHVFELTATDSDGNSNSDTVTITVEAPEPPNLPPVANAGSDQLVASGDTVTLNGSGSSDPDGTIASWSWRRTGGTPGGSVTLNNASAERPVFTADSLVAGSDDVIHVFTLTVTDEVGGTDTDTVTITVTAPSFVIPVANAGPDRTVAAGMEVILDGTGSTVDHHGTIMTYAWKRTGGTGSPVTLTGANTISPVFTADALDADSADVTHVFELTVTNNVGNFDTDTVTITIEAPEYHNPRPVSNAGPDMIVASGATVQLDGSSSSGGVGSLAYTWRQVLGSVVLNNPNTAYPSFTAATLPIGNNDVIYAFSLAVTDDLGQKSRYDSMLVQVKAPGSPNPPTAPNLPPVANAGPDMIVPSGATVQLDGSGSSDSDGVLQYVWGARTSGIKGNSIVLSPGFFLVNPSFEAEVLAPGAVDVIHTFTLTVTDDRGAIDSDTMTVTIVAPFAAPVADAGLDQVVASGATVTLDGSGSTHDHPGSLNYTWTRTGGTSGAGVFLSNANAALSSFTADTLVPGADDVTHIFTLTVTDEMGETGTDTVTVTVEAPNPPPNQPPVPNAGPDLVVASGETFALDASGSTDSDGSIVSYYWWHFTYVSGSDNWELSYLGKFRTPTISLTAETIEPGPVNKTYETYLLRVVDDDGDWSGVDTVRVTVTDPFEAPIANAGPDQVVASGATVTLDGSGSTHDQRRNISYSWEQTDESSSLVSLINADTAIPGFTADTLAPGANDVVHVFTLTVTDEAGETDTDIVTITVVAPFAAPVANAGDDRSVPSGAEVTLDGSDSTVDSSRTIESWSWTRTGGTGVDTMALTGANTASPTFIADTLTPGTKNVTHIFTLSVMDSAGGIDTDTVTITVTAPQFVIPVANAGPDRTVAAGMEVILDGTGSTVDHHGIIVSYMWERTGGTSVDTVFLTGANTIMPVFITNALEAGADDVTHVFELTVTDSTGNSDSDTVTITVEAPESLNLPPVANAGPDQVITPGDTVTLDGSASTDTDGTITYSWRHVQRTSDSSVQLNDPNTAYPSFTAILHGEFTSITHSFVLTVTDDNGAVDEDTVLITIETPNLPPVADAGPDIIVTSGSWVALDGNGSSDMDGPIIRRFGLSVQHFPAGDWSLLTYAWARTGGTPGISVALDSTTEARSGFTADILSLGDADVTHIFTLTVTDDDGAVDVDSVTVTVKAPEAPIADAGPDRTVASGGMVHLDGSGSTNRDGIITYSWARTGGTADDNNSVTLSNLNTANPTFIAGTLLPGANDVIHIFTLTVTNETGHSNTDTMIVTVESPFVTPVANAGPDQTVFPGTVVSLDGSGSTTDYRARPDYAWTRTGGTVNVGVNLSDANTIQTDFTVAPLENGMKHATHVFTLTVTDNETGGISTDTVTITVESPLVANAGKDQLVLNGAIVVLDSSGSTDRNGTIESYAWNRIGGTSTHVPSFSVFDPGTLIFKAEPLTGGDADVTHIFELTVTNNTGQTDTDTVTITVTSGFGVPVANAGDDQVVHSGEIVYLDASGSLGLNDDLMTYAWTNMNETEDSIILTGADTAQPSFKANTLAAGSPDVTHVFSLTVTNGAGVESEAETMTVTVMAPNVTEDVSETVPQVAAAMKVDILVSAPEMTVQEGGSVTYRVKLDQSPGQKVMVEAFSAHKDITLEQQRFAFTEGNWNEWQDVRINTVADSDTENDRAKIEHRFVTKGMTSGQSGTITVTLREIDPILSPVGNYLASRATALLNNQPGLSDFLKRDETTPDENNEFALHATNDRLTINGGFIRNGTWGEITGSYTNSETGDTKSVLASFGVHRKFSENLLAGAMLQFDLADHELPDRTGAIDGTGWLVGPYFAARHNSHPLHFEGRLLYGQSSNDIRFIDRNLGTRTGSFDTTRMLAQLRMEGDIALTDRENGSQLLPYVDAGWVEEKAAAFTDTTGNRIPGQKVSTGQLELGSNLRMPVAMNHGAMTLTGGLGVIWSNTKGQHITSDTQGRGRGEIGFSYDLNENVQIDFESFYDGIGTSDYESYGLSLRAEMKF